MAELRGLENIGTTGSDLDLSVSGTVMWSVDGSGRFVQESVSGGNIVINRSFYGMQAGTSDGSDDVAVIVNGGGAISVNRGGRVEALGNEVAGGFGGSVRIFSGADTEADILLQINHVDSQVQFKNSSANLMWHLDNSGNWEQNSSAGGDIVFNKDFQIKTSVSGLALTLDTDTVNILGNLQVSGTTTTLNTEQLLVEDNIITLNSTVTGSPALNSGFEIERGTSTNAIFRWNEGESYFEAGLIGSENLVLTIESIANIPYTYNNSVYLNWRNVADNDDIDLVSLDSSNNAIFGPITGSADTYLRSTAAMNFNTGGDTIQLHITANGNLKYSGNDSDRFYLYANGGSKIKTLYLTGGDASGASAGATISLQGGDVGGSGTGGDIDFKTADNSSAELRFYTDGEKRWSVAAAGALEFHKSNATFRAGTDDGSDDYAISLCGGGGAANTRGSFILLRGNENTDAGQLFLSAGNIAGGDITLRSYSGIKFAGQGTTTWELTTAGNLEPQSRSAYSVGSAANPVGSIHASKKSHYYNLNTLYATEDYSSSATRHFHTNSSSTRYYVFNNIGSGGQVLQVNGSTMEVPFTGCHVYDKEESEIIEEGDAVKLVNRKLVLCSGSNDPACIGIFTSEEITTETSPSPTEGIYDSFNTQYLRSTSPKTLYTVASCGDSYTSTCSGAKVCNQGGAVVAGDLLVTASGAGFLMKQEDDIVRSRTVAQAVEDVVFDQNSNTEAVGVYVYLLK